VLALFLPACAELPEIRYETEHALIGTSFDAPLCAFDLARVDRHVGMVEELLDARDADKIEVYVYGEVPEQCEPGFGCYDRRREIVLTTWGALEHEVVHAVVARFAEPSLFWDEGAASALDGDGAFRGVDAIDTELDETRAVDLDYNTAGHFARWLLEFETPDKFRSVLEGADFSDTYGFDLDQAQARYEVEAPHSYPPWFECGGAPLPSETESVWHERVEISCEAQGGSRTEGGPFSIVRSVVLEEGIYEIDTSGGIGTRLLGCQTTPFEEYPTEDVHGDIPSQAQSSQTHPGRLFESGALHRFEITERGVFKVVLMARDEGTAMDVRIRSLGA
jgi:hypothetical protein